MNIHGVRESNTGKGELILNDNEHLLCLCCKVNRHFWGSQGWRLNKMQVRIPKVTKQPQTLSVNINYKRVKRHSDWQDDDPLPSKLSGKVQEWLLKIVIALSWNLIVLQVLLPVKSNLFCLHLPILYIHLVTTENNRNVFADPEE